MSGFGFTSNPSSTVKMVFETPDQTNKRLQLENDKLKMVLQNQANSIVKLEGESKDLRTDKIRLELENEELRKKEKKLEMENEELKRNEKRFKLENKKTNEDIKKELISVSPFLLEKLKTNEDIKKELISGMIEMSVRGVKRVGKVDPKPIMDFYEQKFHVKDLEKISMATSSIFQTFLKNQKWQPFKTIQGDDGSKQEIIDDEDEIIKWSKSSFNSEVCNAVVEALMEMNKYNSDEREILVELWNFEENRRATLNESVKVILDELRKYRSI